MPIVASKAYKKYYKAPWFSGASILLILSILICLGLPLALAYLSQSLWVKENSYREIPIVTFKKDVILFLEGVSQTTGIPFTLAWSTNQYYNALNKKSLRNSVLQTSEILRRSPKTMEKFEYKIEVPLSDDESIYHVRAAFVFEYKLKNRIQFAMQTMGLVDVAAPVPLATVELLGDLRLKQRRLLTANPTSFLDLYNIPLFNFTSITDEEYRFGWSSIIQDYTNRDVRTFIDSDAPLWTTGRASGQPLVISGSIRIDEEKIFYQPGVAEVLKFGWVQYISLVLLVVIVVYPTFKFLVRTGIVSTWAVSDKVPYPQTTAYKMHVY